MDLQHHLQAASGAFHANKWILCDKNVSVLHRLRYFEKVVSPVACFGASQRAIHKNDLAKLDVEYRRLMRMVVGPPADANWASPWHEILYGWNNKNSGAVGLRWIETLVCHMRRSSMEVCCNLALATLDSQDALNGTSEDHGNEEVLLTLGRQHCKDIPSNKAVAISLWRLLRMISGCCRYRILCFSLCTLVEVTLNNKIWENKENMHPKTLKMRMWTSQSLSLVALWRSRWLMLRPRSKKGWLESKGTRMSP